MTAFGKRKGDVRERLFNIFSYQIEVKVSRNKRKKAIRDNRIEPEEFIDKNLLGDYLFFINNR